MLAQLGRRAAPRCGKRSTKQLVARAKKVLPGPVLWEEGADPIQQNDDTNQGGLASRFDKSDLETHLLHDLPG